MFTLILILLVFLPITFLPLAMDTFFSSSDLKEMGVSLENTEVAQPECQFLQSNAIAVRTPVVCANA